MTDITPTSIDDFDLDMGEAHDALDIAENKLKETLDMFPQPMKNYLWNVIIVYTEAFADLDRAFLIDNIKKLKESQNV